MLDPAIEEKIRNIIQEATPEAFIIEIALHQSKRSILSILVDTDEGISLPDITRLSRKISRYLDESGDLEITYTLEVSSPGVGSPLKLHRQYLKNVGRSLKVTLNDGKETEGKLIFADESLIRLEVAPKKKNKKETTGAEEDPSQIEIPFVEIKQAKVLVSFK
ncbi:MAG: ribosome assembly cofactor RimP [Bacteroidia bacterium]|nr:ribosome assembly cofactor RimP [Bacteroidia bacterium]